MSGFTFSSSLQKSIQFSFCSFPHCTPFLMEMRDVLTPFCDDWREVNPEVMTSKPFCRRLLPTLGQNIDLVLHTILNCNQNHFWILFHFWGAFICFWIVIQLKLTNHELLPQCATHAQNIIYAMHLQIQQADKMDHRASLVASSSLHFLLVLEQNKFGKSFSKMQFGISFWVKIRVHVKNSSLI